MPELTIISDGAALIGAGAWFADKVLGPSAEALGNQLKAYFSNRIASIFKRAGSIAQDKGIELQPIAPGLLARMVMDASFSDDDDDITTWWANLLVEASSAGSNKHAVFSDMMAVIGPNEAQCLKEFMEGFSVMKPSPRLRDLRNMTSAIDSLQEEAVRIWLGELPVSQERYNQVRSNLLTGEVPWPMRPIAWSFPVRTPEGTNALHQTNPWYAKNVTSIGVLERTRVFEFGRTTVAVGSTRLSAWVKTLSATPLGVDFYAACAGATSNEGDGE